MQPVRHFVILDEAARIKSPDLQKRIAAIGAERAGDQQQGARAHPGEARDHVADVFVGLKKLQRAARRRRLADRNEDAAGRDEFRMGGEGVGDGLQRSGFEMRIRVERDDDVLARLHQGGVERLRLAARRERQMPQRRRADRNRSSGD